MWIQDIAVQTSYLAQSVANTTFEPFVPLPPLAGIASFPPVISQAINAATAATDRVQLAVTRAENAAALLKGQLGMAAGAAGFMAQRGQGVAQKAEAQEAVARNRERQLEQVGENMGKQLIQQAPQQAASMGQQAMQAPQQGLQQGLQQAQQFGSQIGNLMSQVSPEHRLDNPGFFDTQSSSSTLDRLAGSSGTGGITAAVRVSGLAGLSGSSTGFRFPSGWDGSLPAAAPPPAPSTASGGAPMTAARPMGSGMPLRGARWDSKDKTEGVKRPDTELIPVWGNSPEEPETVTAGALATELRPDDQEAT
jgi:hypothetical protein